MGSSKVNWIGLDDVARQALNEILATSIERRKEYGGMICMEAGRYKAMPARTQDEPAKVNVGQYEPNCGCPEGTIPVAYYHTHPTHSVAGFKGKYNEFSDEEKDVARDHNLDAAYMGSLDGSFFRFERHGDKTVRLRGRLKNTE